MKVVGKLLVLTAFAAAIGSAQAVDATFNLGTLSTTVQQKTDFFSTTGYSFEDIFNFTIDANYRALTSSTVKHAPDGIDANQTHVSNLKVELFGGADASGTLLDSVLSLDGGLINLNRFLDPGNFSARVTGKADGQLGGGFRYSVAATPEPAEWMMLVAGLLVMGFIARRKTSVVAG